MNSEALSRRKVLQDLLRSRFARIVLAVAALVLWLAVAHAIWNGRDLIAGFLSVALVIVGFNFAWELLPFSTATRSCLEHSRRLADRCPLYRYRVALWIGAGMAAPMLWRSYTRGNFDPSEFVVSGFLMLVGAISYAVWHLHHRKGVPSP